MCEILCKTIRHFYGNAFSTWFVFSIFVLMNVDSTTTMWIINIDEELHLVWGTISVLRTFSTAIDTECIKSRHKPNKNVIESDWLNTESLCTFNDLYIFICLWNDYEWRCGNNWCEIILTTNYTHITVS